MPCKHKALTGTAIADVGRGGGRKCIIKFALLYRTRHDFNQHARYGLVTVNRYRRGTGFAHGLSVMSIGIRLLLEQLFTRRTFVCVGRILLLKPGATVLAFSLVLFPLHRHCQVERIA